MVAYEHCASGGGSDNITATRLVEVHAPGTIRELRLCEYGMSVGNDMLDISHAAAGRQTALDERFTTIHQA